VCVEKIILLNLHMILLRWLTLLKIAQVYCYT